MTSQGDLNLQFSQQLMDGLASAGLTQVVISPGSRSTPLTLVCERHQALTTYIQIDERCAAFFALGLAREQNQPVAVIATSGSAAGHWLPAVIEAKHSAIPLILISADRPPELLHCGANQTIDQNQLFASQVRHFYQLPLAEASNRQAQYLQQLGQRVLNESLYPLAGPVHLNVPFREPLIPEVISLAKENKRTPVLKHYPKAQLSEAEYQQLAEQFSTGRGLIIAGPDKVDNERVQAIAQLADHLQVPVFADPLSGLRFGEHNMTQILCHYDAFLRKVDFVKQAQVDWILRFGAMPISKALGQYLQHNQQAQQLVVDSHMRWRDPNHQINAFILSDDIVLCEKLMQYSQPNPETAWRDFLLGIEQRAWEQALDCCTEAQLLNELLQQLPESSVLFASNSLPVRELDSFSNKENKKITLIANRGASGIDGNVSTLAGLAANRTNHQNTDGEVVGLLGDLACYHDMNGLLVASKQDMIIIVINNGGGGIFYHLPPATLPEFKQAWLTPHELEFEKVAALYQLQFYKLHKREQFSEVLAQVLNVHGCRMIEVVIDPEQSLQQHRDYWQAVADNI